VPLRIGRALAERLARAPAAVVAFVPPLARGRVPVTLVVRSAKVVEVVPVPPLAIGRVPVT
jgi:NAD(P)-dependent dehydrogenase (short-subunit alcohol dehydrogenase family)